MSDTPRTDAAAWREHQQSVVDADFARELERDLIAAQGYRAAAEEIATRRGEMVDALIAERDEARRLYSVEMSRQSSDPKRFTPEWYAKELCWDCFEEAKP